MPKPFSPVHIPFVSGVRQDIGKIAQTGPEQLLDATNVMYTKKGHLTGRPRLQNRDALVRLADGVHTSPDIGTATAGLTPAGIVATGYQSDIDSSRSSVETPMALYQSAAYYDRSGVWEYAGRFWSVRQTKSAILEIRDPQAAVADAAPQVPCASGGQVGLVTAIGGQDGIPVLNSAGEVSFGLLTVGSMGTSGSLNLASVFKRCAAGRGVFWTDSTDQKVYGAIQPTAGDPTTVNVTINNNVSTATIAACTDNSGNYYVLYGTSVGSGLSVSKISSTGTVLQTLALTFAQGAFGQREVDICWDPTTNRLGLAAISVSVAQEIRSKILTLTAGVMADAGIEMNFNNSFSATSVSDFSVGVSHNGLMSLVASINGVKWTTGTSVIPTSCYIGGRSFTTTAEMPHMLLVGAQNNSGFGQNWSPLFGARVLAGRTVVGVYHGYDRFWRSAQWIVLDATELYNIGAIGMGITGVPLKVVASSPSSTIYPAHCGSVSCDGTTLNFGVSEGTTFAVGLASDVTGVGGQTEVSRTGSRRISLSLQASQAEHAHGITYLSGQNLQVFDGTAIRDQAAPEGGAYIHRTDGSFALAVAGGSLPAGNYTYQATWEFVNSRGQVVRTPASAPYSVPGVPLNNKVQIRITLPQLTGYGADYDSVRVRLWATQVNPSNDALKYLAAQTTVQTLQIGGNHLVTLEHTSQAIGTEESLVELAETLPDDHCPSADRGVAYVNERIWTADQNNLYASKQIRTNVAAAWSNDSTLTLSVPSALGTIEALSSFGLYLVVLGSKGVAIVQGPGVDDSGTGQGWQLQIVDGAAGMGSSSPRSAARSPGGVVYQAVDGALWLLSGSGTPVPFSRNVRDKSTLARAIDVVSLAPTKTTNTMVVAHGANNELRVADMESGSWCAWTFQNLTVGSNYLAAIGGVLWMQSTVGGFNVTSVDDVTNTGDIVSNTYPAVISTGQLRPGNPTGKGWGRLRSVFLNEPRTAANPQVSVNMSVFADQEDRPLMNKTLLTSPNTDPVSGFVSAGAPITSQGSSVTVAMPAGTAVGDTVLVLAWCGRSRLSEVSAPAGWQVRYSQTVGGQLAQMFSHVVAGGDPSSVVFPIPSISPLTPLVCAVAVAFRGLNAQPYINGDTAFINATTPYTIAAQNISGSTEFYLGLVVGNNNTATVTLPPGTTSLVNATATQDGVARILVFQSTSAVRGTLGPYSGTFSLSVSGIATGFRILNNVSQGPDGALEFRTSTQKCSSCRIVLSITPAVFDIEGLDLWVMNTGENDPTNNRS